MERFSGERSRVEVFCEAGNDFSNVVDKGRLPQDKKKMVIQSNNMIKLEIAIELRKQGVSIGSIARILGICRDDIVQNEL